MKKVKVKTLLKEIHKLEFLDCIDFIGIYDEGYSFKGAIRLICGLWNDGCNEKGTSMLAHMNPHAQSYYRKLIKKYKKYKPIDLVI